MALPFLPSSSTVVRTQRMSDALPTHTQHNSIPAAKVHFLLFTPGGGRRRGRRTNQTCGRERSRRGGGRSREGSPGSVALVAVVSLGRATQEVGEDPFPIWLEEGEEEDISPSLGFSISSSSSHDPHRRSNRGLCTFATGSDLSLCSLFPAML